MSDPLAKVSPGAPLRIPAEAYNSFIDVAKAHQADMLSSGSQSRQPPGAAVVKVRNDTGADLARFGVVELDGVVVTPTDNELNFIECPVFKGVTPTGDPGAPFAVAQAPIPLSSIGPARVSGVSFVTVDVQAESDAWAVPAASATASLVSRSTPPGAQILWKEAGTGEALGVAVLGASVDLFLGRVVDEGPEAEPDFEDGRYWVQPVAVEFDEDGKPTPSDVGTVVQAFNIGELGHGASAIGGHYLMKIPARLSAAPDRYVIVRGSPGSYTLNEPPLIYLPASFHLDPTSLDANDCVDDYKWFHGVVPVGIDDADDPPP